MENAYLAHYGVKGMKWGVRKERGLSKNKAPVLRQLSTRQQADGATALHMHATQQLMQMQAQQALAEANRASINAGLQAASLSMTGGTNPFMFGMM